MCDSLLAPPRVSFDREFSRSYDNKRRQAGGTPAVPVALFPAPRSSACLAAPRTLDLSSTSRSVLSTVVDGRGGSPGQPSGRVPPRNALCIHIYTYTHHMLYAYTCIHECNVCDQLRERTWPVSAARASGYQIHLVCRCVDVKSLGASLLLASLFPPLL